MKIFNFALKATVYLLLSLLLLNNTSQAATKTLVIFFNSDTNSQLEESEEAISAAKISTYVKQARKHNDYVIFLNAGNSLYGTIDANLSKGTMMRDIFNEMTLDVMNIGPKDFDFSLDNILSLTELANFKIINSNIINNRGHLVFEPYVKIEKGPFKIAIIGAISSEPTLYTNPKNISNLTFMNPKQIADNQITALKGEGANLIIALTNLGAQATIPLINRSTYLATVQGISFIIDGNDAINNPEELNVGDVSIYKPGKDNHVLGQMTIKMYDDGKIDSDTKYLTKNDLKDTKPDSNIISIIKDYKKQHHALLQEVVIKNTSDLSNTKLSINNLENNLLKVVAQATQNTTSAQLSIIPSYYVHNDLPQGPVKYIDIINSIHHTEHELITVEMKGSDIVALLEYAFAHAPDDLSLVPAVSGLTFDLDLQSPPNDRISNVKINGEDLLYTGQYTVATTDFAKFSKEFGYPILEQQRALSKFDNLGSSVISLLKSSDLLNVLKNKHINVLQ